MDLKWYAVHTQTGLEDHVKLNIVSRSVRHNCEDKIAQIIIPMEKVSEVRAGKKKVSDRKFFPGYILVQMEMTNDAWYLVTDTPGVTGFIGSGKKPTPLNQSEVSAIIKASEEKQEKSTPKVVYEKGENIRVKEGPFENFNGEIEEVNPEKGKLKVKVAIFGRTTPVELEYWQVEKL
jgi:transcriptional antiterminator NusG